MYHTLRTYVVPYVLARVSLARIPPHWSGSLLGSRPGSRPGPRPDTIYIHDIYMYMLEYLNICIYIPFLIAIPIVLAGRALPAMPAAAPTRQRGGDDAASTFSAGLSAIFGKATQKAPGSTHKLHTSLHTASRESAIGNI